VIKRLDSFVTDAKSLSWEDFRRKHDYFVLVIVPTDDGDDQVFTTSRHARPGSPSSRPPLNANYRVGLMTKRDGGNPFQCFITVGRATNNDIVVPNIEISKVHAFFERNESGRWTIRDNKSTNGTYVNGVRVPDDERTQIKSTDIIKIGPGVSSVFFDPGDFYQFLKSPEAEGSF